MMNILIYNFQACKRKIFQYVDTKIVIEIQ
jgi:hypothetical protein